MAAKEERRRDDDDDVPSCSALARKRRRELRQQQRGGDDAPSSLSSDSKIKRPRVHVLQDEKPKPSIVGIKRQARYEPGVPMTKEELVVWRKEARRVRNRESAAASRKKTRDKIDELEGKLQSLQSKYDAAMERILELEDVNSRLVSIPKPMPLHPSTSTDDSGHSSVVSPQCSPPVSPSTTPRASFVVAAAPEDDGHHHQLEVENRVQHIIEMISRPNA